MGHKYRIWFLLNKCQFQDINFLCYVKQSRNASWINVATSHVKKRKEKKRSSSSDIARTIPCDLRDILFQQQKWAGVCRRTIRWLELITYYGLMRMTRDSLWDVTSIIRSSCNSRGPDRVTMSMSIYTCIFNAFFILVALEVFLNRY